MRDRSESKMRNGYGIKYLEAKGVSPLEHSKLCDKLYGIKGLERYHALRNSPGFYKTRNKR
jgi:hypothetical protein